MSSFQNPNGAITKFKADLDDYEKQLQNEFDKLDARAAEMLDRFEEPNDEDTQKMTNVERDLAAIRERHRQLEKVYLEKTQNGEPWRLRVRLDDETTSWTADFGNFLVASPLKLTSGGNVGVEAAREFNASIHEMRKEGPDKDGGADGKERGGRKEETPAFEAIPRRAGKKQRKNLLKPAKETESMSHGMFPAMTGNMKAPSLEEIALDQGVEIPASWSAPVVCEQEAAGETEMAESGNFTLEPSPAQVDHPNSPQGTTIASESSEDLFVSQRTPWQPRERRAVLSPPSTPREPAAASLASDDPGEMHDLFPTNRDPEVPGEGWRRSPAPTPEWRPGEMDLSVVPNEVILLPERQPADENPQKRNLDEGVDLALGAFVRRSGPKAPKKKKAKKAGKGTHSEVEEDGEKKSPGRVKWPGQAHVTKKGNKRG